MNISINKAPYSKIDNVDFNQIPFGRIFTDHMFIMEYKQGAWHNARIEPLRALSIHPSNLALHYGQSIFEGMKASKNKDGMPLLFRPEMHAKRMNASAHRMCMPKIDEDLFVEAIRKLVYLEKDWIPNVEGSAMYIRPIMFATDEYLGVAPSENYTFIIMTLPVGPYYSKPVRLLASDTYVRAARGGVGEAKTAGNYAASLYPTQKALELGYDQILWLDGVEFRYTQEVGTMNIFFCLGDRIVTPSTTDGTILKGITRDSFLIILREKGYNVEERPVTIDEIVEAHEGGQLKEVFGSGTAAVAINVEKIAYKGLEMNIDPKGWTIAKELKEEINGLRNGSVSDKRGWVVPVLEGVNV